MKKATLFCTDILHSMPESAAKRLPAALTRGLVLPLVLLGFLAAASLAQADGTLTNHSGTLCKSYDPSYASVIDHLSWGTVNLSSVDLTVVCPLTRNTSTSGGAYVDVIIDHFGTQTTTCTAYSYSYRDTLLASASQSWTGSGVHAIVLNLYGAGKSDAWSNYSVYCHIAANGNSGVTAVNLVEY